MKGTIKLNVEWLNAITELEPEDATRVFSLISNYCSIDYNSGIEEFRLAMSSKAVMAFWVLIKPQLPDVEYGESKDLMN